MPNRESASMDAYEKPNKQCVQQDPQQAYNRSRQPPRGMLLQLCNTMADGTTSSAIRQCEMKGEGTIG